MNDLVLDPATGLYEPPLGKPHILQTVSTVIDECKRDGARLMVERKQAGHFELRGLPETGIPGHGRLVRLCTAFTHEGSRYLKESEESGITGRKSNWLVSESVFTELNAHLDDDKDTIRRLSTWPIERSFVYVDVSDFSQHYVGQQALIIGSLVSLVRDFGYWNMRWADDAWHDLEAMLCIGDGYIFVLKDAVHATFFAAHLAQTIESRVANRRFPVAFHFRTGVHVGPVYCFWDWGRGGNGGSETAVETVQGKPERTEEGDWNYVGEGINGGQRVLAAVGKDVDDVVFISGHVREKLEAHRQNSDPAQALLSQLVNRGRRADKHNKFWRVYEVGHTAICGGNLPSDVGQQ